MNDHRQPDDPQALRARLRADLTSAMKVRQAEAIAALRSALAAIDNAEAVDASANADAPQGGPIAGASTGVGSTEAERRILAIEDIQALLEQEIDTRIAAADRYEHLHKPDMARRLRQEAEILRRYLAT